MRMGELSRRSGVSVPTIKYYLREGLLPAGNPLGLDELLAGMDTYADAAELVARHDIDTVVTRAQRGGPGDEQALMIETVITGTVLGESLLTGLRLLAQEATSARTLGDER